MKRVLVLAALALFVPSTAAPQALPNMASVRVRYNTQKATVQPQGELKAKIDELDRQIAEASKLGHVGELRRLFAKGTTLLAGREWTDALDFANSLAIRSDRVVVDSAHPYVVRLEQIYMPAAQLDQSLTAHATLRKRPQGAQGAQSGQGATEVVKDLGKMDGVARDLRESPALFELDLQGVPDGPYQLTIDVADGAKALGGTTLAIAVRKGLDDLAARLEADAMRAPEALRADILFPIDRMKNVNLGRLELRTFDPDRDFADAEEIAASVRLGKNPFTARTGDFKRHYLLESASEIMPYRLYVPKNYAPGAQGAGFPLIVALHGLGGTEDSFFTGYDNLMPKLAEQHGYIIAAPLGYRVDGSYGWGLGNQPPDPNVRRLQERSEDDVMQMLRLVRQQYRIDENRIYLAGHSMGAIGTWKIAPKFPEIWAAIAPFAGSGTPSTLERIRHIPEFVVHGDDDRTVPVQGSRSMVAGAKDLGIDVTYVEVPGGSHGGVVAPNLSGMFDFFNAHRKGGRNTSQP